jgi:hypothetical protein
VNALAGEDVVMAINYAMDHRLAEGAAWWVAMDLWQQPLPKHRPREGMVTCSAAIEEGQAKLVPYHLVNFRQHPLCRGVSTTLPAALWWAAHLGARSVRLYGCDLAGDRDYRGDQNPIGRTPDRWEKERQQCREVAELTGLHIEGMPC